MAVTIDVKADILGKNDAVAEELRNLFKEKHVFVLDLMGSPGCGKTTLLEKTMQALKDDINMAVIEGDLFTSKDADRIDRYGVPVVQINTAGGCHLDAPMIKKALENIDLDKLDLLVIENVGNLVCPAEFDIGEQKRAVVLSITEAYEISSHVQACINRAAEQDGYLEVLQFQPRWCYGGHKDTQSRCRGTARVMLFGRWTEAMAGLATRDGSFCEVMEVRYGR